MAINRPDTGSGGGGRVAVVLASGNDFGSIDSSARGGTTGHGNGSSAPGTVYLESASDGAGRGRVIVDCKGEDFGKNTYLPPESNPVHAAGIGCPALGFRRLK